MLIAVGSENPVKVAAVAEAAAEFWPEARVVPARVASLVAAQPDSERESYAGALNRARQALERTPAADYGVGLEGGVLEGEHGMWAFAWVVVVDRQERVGKGKTGHFLLPEGVARPVRAGMELGDAADLFFGRTDSKREEGAIHMLSGGKLTRTALYKQGVVFALLRFVRPEYYDDATT